MTAETRAEITAERAAADAERVLVNRQATQPVVDLDGAQGEGGGQILRTALALSMITGKPLVLNNIRAKRAKPGLMRQHLMCVQAAARISGAQVEGAELGATALQFHPGRVQAGDHEFAIASAGSCMLVLQTVLPALMLAAAPSRLVLRGGTHNHMAPSFHFVRDAFAPLLARLGPQLDLRLLRHGFYPAGGGEVHARITPAPLVPFDLLARGALTRADALCLTPGVPGNVARRELDALAQALGWGVDQLVHGDVKQHEGPGNALIATLRFAELTEVFVELGAKNLSSEQVAGRLVKAMRDYQKKPEAAVGPHLADQLVLLQALAVWQAGQHAPGEAASVKCAQPSAQFSCSEVTEHLRTNCAVIERFLPVRLRVGAEKAPVVRIEGRSEAV